MSARDGHRRRVRHACMPRGVTPASRARTSEICRHASRVLDGIDLGGTRIYAAVLDAAGRVVWGRCIAAPVDDCAATVHALADQVGIARIRNDATAVSACGSNQRPWYSRRPRRRPSARYCAAPSPARHWSRNACNAGPPDKSYWDGSKHHDRQG